MFYDVKDLLGYRLYAIDEDIGHIKDFYFDDQTWAIRYLIADTGSWLSSHKVLVSPYAFVSLDREKRRLYLRLTKKQIAEGPLIATELPVSRQFEVDYYKNFGFPFYWQGGGMWGTSAIPTIPIAQEAGLSESVDTPRRLQGNDDPHLRSIHAIMHYHIWASDGDVGRVHDFLIDEPTWSIQHIVIKTVIWFAGRNIWLPVDNIKAINFRESTISIDMTRDEIQQRPQFYQQQVGQQK